MIIFIFSFLDTFSFRIISLEEIKPNQSKIFEKKTKKQKIMILLEEQIFSSEIKMQLIKIINNPISANVEIYYNYNVKPMYFQLLFQRINYTRQIKKKNIFKILL